MSEKDEALQHLSEIKSVLVDKDSFFPYNYNALVVWGIIGAIMTLVMPILMKYSVLQGTIFSIVVMGIGFMIESFLTKKVNEDYNIDNCTKKQKFIASTYTMLTFFAIALSALLAKFSLIIPIFALWLFLCGMGNYAVGYVLNIKMFTLVSFLSTSVAVLLLTVAYFIDDLSSIQSMFFYISEGVSFLLLGVAPILIARKLKEEQ